MFRHNVVTTPGMRSYDVDRFELKYRAESYISTHIFAISNGDQWRCLIRYRNNLGPVSILFSFFGALTRAILMIIDSASGVHQTRLQDALLCFHFKPPAGLRVHGFPAHFRAPIWFRQPILVDSYISHLTLAQRHALNNLSWQCGTSVYVSPAR